MSGKLPSLADLVASCDEGSEGVWARRCLADVIISIWFKEDFRPSENKFYMIKFLDEEHARACCRGEAPIKTVLVDMAAFKELHPEDARTEEEKSRVFTVLLVSGASFFTFINVPRFSMAFWSSMQERINAKAVFDKRSLNRTWCNGCLKREANMRRCRNCKTAPYCSAACIKSDWRRHKPCCTMSPEPR